MSSDKSERTAATGCRNRTDSRQQVGSSTTLAAVLALPSGFRTIGFRLTVWGAGITFGICLLVCAALYVGVWYSLHREVDRFLEGEIREFVGVVQEHRFNFAEAQQLIRHHLGSRTRVDLTFRVLDPHGSPVLTSSVEDPIPAEYTSRGSPGATRFETLQVPGYRHAMRVCSAPMRGPTDELFIAQASYALDHVGASLSMFRTVSMIALLAAVMLSVIGGRLLARRSLKPLHRMIGTAQRISANSLSERLPRSHNRDELDRLAETLNDLLDRIQQYVRRMQQFTADASHELRSPLAALQGNAEVALARERTVDELRGVIESSIDHYRRLCRLTEDLLLLARMDAEEDILQRERFSLDQAVDDVVDLYGPTAAEAGLELLFEEREPVTLSGDGGRLRQVVANLVDNAIKYTRPPGRIGISLTRENGMAVIRVADTGVGISEPEISHVFDRFYRVDRARGSGGQRGAGLGLAICQSIVRGHKGTIALQNGPQGGTVVTVALPVSAL